MIAREILFTIQSAIFRRSGADTPCLVGRVGGDGHILHGEVATSVLNEVEDLIDETIVKEVASNSNRLAGVHRSSSANKSFVRQSGEEMRVVYEGAGSEVDRRVRRPLI